MAESAPEAPSCPERYRRLHRLAAGGQGEVWVARDLSLGRDVVLKVGNGGPGAAARLRQEARIAAQLDHPTSRRCTTLGWTPRAARSW
ncbi:MAG: serine/threonine protein kinase [Myxococcota bacterium]